MSLAVAAAIAATSGQAQDYSSLDTPQEMPVRWIGNYAKDLRACRDDGDLYGITIERRGLHFYEAAALAQRIVWVDQDRELYLYALLGGEGSIGPATYRIRRNDDGSIIFFGGVFADDDSAQGERMIRCPD